MTEKVNRALSNSLGAETFKDISDTGLKLVEHVDYLNDYILGNDYLTSFLPELCDGLREDTVNVLVDPGDNTLAVLEIVLTWLIYETSRIDLILKSGFCLKTPRGF